MRWTVELVEGIDRKLIGVDDTRVSESGSAESSAPDGKYQQRWYRFRWQVWV